MKISSQHYYHNNSPIFHNNCQIFIFDNKNGSRQWVSVVNGTAIELTISEGRYTPSAEEALQLFKEMIDNRLKRDNFIANLITS